MGTEEFDYEIEYLDDNDPLIKPTKGPQVHWCHPDDQGTICCKTLRTELPFADTFSIGPESEITCSKFLASKASPSLPLGGNEFLLAPDSVPTGGVTFSEKELRMVRELAALRGPVVVLPDDASYTYEDSPPRVSDAFDFSRTYYIAGPMTGYPNYNYPAFRAAEDILTRTGVKCLTPLQDDMALAEMDETLKWQLCMKYATGQLLAADGIILLKGWPGSRGACRELALAIDLGYPVWYYHEYQLTLMSDPQ